jgi:hypothetical protein
LLNIRAPKIRDYKEEKLNQTKAEKPKTHPLEEDSENLEYDPLRSKDQNYGFVSLGKAAKQPETESKKTNSSILNWNSKTSGYLKKYTTDKNIPVFSV